MTLEVLFRLRGKKGNITFAAAVQQQTSAGFFLRIPIHKNITHTNRNFSCNSDLKIVMKRGTIS